MFGGASNALANLSYDMHDSVGLSYIQDLVEDCPMFIYLAQTDILYFIWSAFHCIFHAIFAY